ncbi:MarR family winged helix-turn-helix transcriptional regulator [Actinoplanes aureus]|uniref:MarR family transcriptional regulator n=1 Tax=Actinoplanes aureus TaxID=2792083 RepID=A0A931C1E0_9ACTN|nr:MarR family transcriptional regulator [Actinoplanes aureus]MBG0561519.1 MarR family transcriptional regulator [Actinoplanes aureus]
MAEPLSSEANLLGALALVLTDRMAEAAAAEAGEAGAAAAALSSLYHFLDRPTLDTLRRVLGLTHSGAVRLVNRLEAQGLVTRGPGEDGRSRAVTLTPAGRQAAARVDAARSAVLERALDRLPPDQRAVLHGLLGQVMTAVVRDKDGGAWICRLCDLGACGRDQGRCPTANAAAAKYGPPA